MSGNTFGTLFRVTTWGESHGKALGVVIDGCPPLLHLTEEDIQKELDRRKPGHSQITSKRKENDVARILSGVFEEKTLGTPIAIMVENKDQHSEDYSKLKDIYRPGHADLAWELKYGIRDYRGGGRSSGRETVARVMAGAVAKKILEKANKTRITGHTIQIGTIKTTVFRELEIERNLVRAADPKAAKEMEKEILAVQQTGDSLGGIVEIIVKNTPAGLGEPVFDKLQADLAKALLSIGSVKGIEFGDGFQSAMAYGSEQNDEIVSIKTPKGQSTISTRSNHAGGISGGISLGTDLIIRIAIKPPSSIQKKQKTIDRSLQQTEIQVGGRHDPCIVPRLIPVAESMVAITLADLYLRHKNV